MQHKKACWVHFVGIISCLIITLSPMAKAQINQEEAILKTLKTLKEAYFNADTLTLNSLWLHDRMISSTRIAKWGYSTLQGWDKMGPEIKKLTKFSSIDPALIRHENVKIKLDGKLAYAEFDVIDANPISNTAFNFTSHDYELFINENNKWKIFNHVKVYPNSYAISDQTIEEDLNGVGYQLLEKQKIKEAIDVFKTNVRLYPASWNAYDSLGEAYARAGETKLAIDNYEKSVQLNPENKNGKEALGKLRK